MASKRSAGSELNHINWEEEDEPEQAGLFKKASQDVLQKRVIKTAKRRNLISSNLESNTKSVFGSFSGFNKTPATSTAFAFLNKMTPAKEAFPSVNGINTVNSSTIDTSIRNINSSTVKASECKIPNEKEEYYAKLKGLNESVSVWIKKHVDSNPLIDLRPIFKDYENYFNELEIKSFKSDELIKPNIVTCSNTKLNDDSTKYKKELSSFIFKSSDSEKPVYGTKPIPQFSFGTDTIKNEDKNVTSSSKSKLETASSTCEKSENTNIVAFNFGSNLITSPPTISFTTNVDTNTNSFGGGSHTKPFTFANATQSTNHHEHNEDQDEEPPKVEFTPVVEDGHTYTVKCKVFVKNQDSFGDRGVGVLYLKPIANNDKTQLIVRADTNLGNLLCNFILSKNIPTKRMGKKDVMLVCLPTPEFKPPPIPMLLRVKSSEQADELLMELEKHKK